MALCFVSLVSLVKPHDTMVPYPEIMTHFLRYKRNGKTWSQTTSEQCTSVTFSQNKPTATWVYSYSKQVMNFIALYQTVA